MPFYDHLCSACGEVFEDFYSAKKDPPTICQLCGVDGYVQRQIPDVVHGRVPLTGQELKQQIKKDTQSMRAKVSKNENVKANMVGEEKYNQHVIAMDKLKETYKN